MERNMSATDFDANAHFTGYRKNVGDGLERNLPKSTESDPIEFH
jgi:hypothetical protein